MKSILLFIIKIYQALASPILVQLSGSHCRYPVTCSDYAKQAIEKEGVIAGSLKSMKRILSCSPLNKAYEYS